MNKKWVVPMILTVAMITTPVSTYAHEATVTGVKQTEQQVQKQKINQLKVPVFVSEKDLKNNDQNDVGFISDNNKKTLDMTNSKGDFNVIETKKDKLGMKHVTLQQMVNGVPVEGSEIIVHYGKDGQVNTINGYYNRAATPGDMSIRASISKDKALETAKTAISAPDVLPYDPTAKLVVYPYKGENYLAYKTNVNFLGKNPGNWYVYVNAKNGEVIDKINTIMDLGQYKKAKGSGFGVLGEHRNLHISHKNIPDDGLGTLFFLNDISHENLGGIRTYDFNNQWSGQLPGKLYSDKDAAFHDKYDRAAVDAHYNSEKVYEYYLEEHNRNSIDGEGMAIVSTVHFGKNFNNAFWNGKQMTYGDGDGDFFISLSAGLDVAAHEMTHGVTTHSAGLHYRFQSGALNESFSDIFGALVDKEDWEVGEEIMGDEAVASGRTSLRSLSNPNKYMVSEDYVPYGDGSGTYPSHMSQFYDLPLELDNGGVHINSSIFNHAAYLTGTEIGKDKLGQIYYRALVHYLTPTSKFSDARRAVVQSAVDLYGENSAEVQACIDGFNEVGITK